MKKTNLTLLLISLFINLHAQTFDWAKRAGLWAYDYGYGITTDNTGNVYIAGKYEGNAIFEGTTIPNHGNHDIYLAQYSQAGALNWVKTAGGTLGDYAHSIACDGTNYVYIAGEIEGYGNPISFDGTSTSLNCIGNNDVFFAKYDLNGNLQWAKQDGWWHDEKALGITYDHSGNVYICGYFNDTTYFNSNMILGFGGNDIFIAKYDINGNFQWIQKAGSPGRDEAKSIKCDAAGNVYICGMYSDSAVFGTQILSSPLGYFNTFLAKYTPEGTLSWVKTAGGDYDDVAWSLTIDNAGKIYVTGEFNAYALFDVIPLTTSGHAEAFVACYDSLGGLYWATPAGGGLPTRARGIGCDGTDLYITGQFGGTAVFGSINLTAVDSSDIFMAKINNAGTFMWATAVEGVADSTETLGYESGNAICADATGSVYATGSILDGGVFGTSTLPEYGRTDIFITKIGQGADLISPAEAIYNPADNSNNVATSANLIITFNEIIQKGTGNIIIKEGGLITQTIDVEGANVTISGNKATIDAASDFTLGALVNIEFAAGVFKDISNNNDSGITDTSTWNFSISDTAATKVKEITPQNIISIYPNPGNGNFSIDVANFINQKIEVTIFNCLGEYIEKKKVQTSSIINIDLSAQKEGIYFVEVKGDKATVRKKFILQ